VIGRGVVSTLWTRSRLKGAIATLGWARKGVRIHPSARIDMRTGLLRAARGVKVSDRCRIRADLGSTIELDTGVWIAEDCAIESIGRIVVGANTTIQRRTSIIGSVEIGQDCILAPNVFISSGTHPIRRWPHLPIREQERRMEGLGEPPHNARVVIGDDCWLGVNVVISPGVSIGQGAVIGANAVVTTDVLPYAVMAGSPARQISERLVWAPPTSLELTDPASLPYVVGAETVYDGDKIIAMVAESTKLFIADLAPERAAVLEVDVVKPATVILNGSVHELSNTGRIRLRVSHNLGSSISVSAPGGAIRLIALRTDGMPPEHVPAAT
jgi:acetyltransferase-like isoleucine patch superfamily enzyme